MARTNDTAAMQREADGDRRWRPGQMAGDERADTEFVTTRVSDARADFEQTTRDIMDRRGEDWNRMLNVLSEVSVERGRQDEKWGQQNHDPLMWCGILMEEVGEAARACIETHGTDSLRSEIIQVAAVAVAWVECLDRHA